jgi:hypothetical protein
MGANVTLFLQNNEVDSKELEKVRVNVLGFYVELCTQIRKVLTLMISFY